MAGNFSGKPSPKIDIINDIRKRPGMYIGSFFPRGINKVIYEGIANSVDQFLLGLSTKIKLNVTGGIITIFDDGNGLPFHLPSPDNNFDNLVEYYLTNSHDSPTADNHAPHIHLMGSCLGLTIINAVSKKLMVKSGNGQYIWSQEFCKGKIVSKAVISECNKPSFSEFKFELDNELLHDHLPDLSDLRKTMFELAHFYPGLVVEFQDEKFKSQNGLLDLACLHYKDQEVSWAYDLPQKFYYQGISENIQFQVAAIGETTDDTEYRSWINGSITVCNGTHVNGLKAAFKKANWNPKTALIHVIMHQPEYAGPSKDALTNKNVTIVIEREMQSPLEKLLNKRHYKQ